MKIEINKEYNATKLINRNFELEKENQKWKEAAEYYQREMESEQAIRESDEKFLKKYIQAMQILNDYLVLQAYEGNYYLIFINKKGRYFVYLTKEQYENETVVVFI